MINLTINQTAYQIDADPDMPLLWVIRDIIGLPVPNLASGNCRLTWRVFKGYLFIQQISPAALDDLKWQGIF